jgi:NAD(P)-dependent dehydrogenase (short-subunit alcohol dehydrogenase family)
MAASKRTILITGATSGIGEITAKAFAAKGWAVVGTGRRADRGAALVKAITAAGGKASFVTGDVTDEAHLAAAVATAVKTYGGLTAAFNNAGVEGDAWKPLADQSLANYRHVMDTNVWGVVASMKAEIPALIASGGGAIVNNASIAGLKSFPAFGVYVASKFAVVGLTRNGATEYAKAGVRVNAVAPGPIETDMYDRFATPEVKQQIVGMMPMGRAGKPEEIANAVLWLCDPENSYTTGQVVAVDGGFLA